jgi:iron(III) transport system permease protein
MRDSAGVFQEKNTVGQGLKKMFFRTRRWLSRPEKIMGLILIAVLAVLVVIPLIQIVVGASTFSYSDVQRRHPDSSVGDWTIYHWQRVIASQLTPVLLVKPLLHSLAIALGVVLVALPLGSLLGWLVVRTDLPLKKLMGNLAIIPYVMPSWVMALAWFTVFKNSRIGGSPGFLEAIGISVPNWLAYGYIPIVLAMTIHYFPYAFILVSGAIASMDSQLEETGRVLGASQRTVLRKITFPLMLPALGSAFVLIFSKALGTFGTPAILGLPVKYYTVATRVYHSIRNGNAGTAYALVIFLVAISSLTIYMNAKVIGVRKKFTTIGGKGTRVKTTKLGRARIPAAVLVFTFIGVCILAPLSMLLLQSLTLHGDFNLSELTLKFWIGAKGEVYASDGGILRDPAVLSSMWNTIRLSVVSALVASFSGLFFGYAVVKARGSFLSKLIENLAFTPYIIPSIAFGGIFLSMFAKSWGPLPSLYGTFTLLVLVTVAKRLPYTSRTGISAMMQIDKSLEEAAYLRGVSWVKRMWAVIIPLGKSGMMAGFILSLITTMRMLSLIILLVTPKTMVLTAMTYRYVEQGFTQQANAIACLIIVMTLSGYFLATKLGKSKLEHIGG